MLLHALELRRPAYIIYDRLFNYSLYIFFCYQGLCCVTLDFDVTDTIIWCDTIFVTAPFTCDIIWPKKNKGWYSILCATEL